MLILSSILFTHSRSFVTIIRTCKLFSSVLYIIKMQKGKKSYTRRRKATKQTKRRRTRNSKRTYRNKRGGNPDEMITAKADYLEHVQKFLPLWEETEVSWLTLDRLILIENGLKEGKLPRFLIEQLDKLPETAFSSYHLMKESKDRKMKELTELQKWASEKQAQQKKNEPASEETNWDSDLAAFKTKMESQV